MRNAEPRHRQCKKDMEWDERESSGSKAVNKKSSVGRLIKPLFSPSAKEATRLSFP